MKAFVAFFALLAVAASSPVSPPYHPAPYQPAPYHPAPAYKEAPAAYQYQYAVKDDYAGLNFGANEARDGYATNGEYSVALPDGRIQNVKYTVGDAYSGFVADVTYSGEPQYAPAPAYKPAPPPAYKPAPVYKPAPIYHA